MTQTGRWLACVAAAVAFSASAGAQIYVDASKPAPGDGMTWNTAYPDLNDGLLDAAMSGQDVWVVEGTYLPGLLRTDTFLVPTGIGLYGGFLGGELSVAGRLGKFNKTILSGDLNGVPTDKSTDSYHVVTIAPGASGVTVDGFAIKYGNADLTAPTIAGGGMLVLFADTLLIENVKFHNNMAVAGGGLSATFSSFDVKYCTFKNNRAQLDGGGIRAVDVARVRIHSTLFDTCRALLGGGIYFESIDGPFEVANGQFRDNRAAQGGAVYAAAQHGNTSTFVNCTLAYNLALASGVFPGVGAGFYYVASSDPRIIANSILWNNEDENGGIWDMASNIEGPGASSVAVRFSDVEMSATMGLPWPGPGNIGADPVFANGNNRKLKLRLGSPCIDAADDLALPPDSLDLDGDVTTTILSRDFTKNNPREQDEPNTPDTAPDFGDFGVVDMGCFEVEGNDPPL